MMILINTLVYQVTLEQFTVHWPMKISVADYDVIDQGVVASPVSNPSHLH